MTLCFQLFQRSSNHACRNIHRRREGHERSTCVHFATGAGNAADPQRIFSRHQALK